MGLVRTYTYIKGAYIRVPDKLRKRIERDVQKVKEENFVKLMKEIAESMVKRQRISKGRRNGLSRTKTRSTFAWRAASGSTGALEKVDLISGFDYAPVGESTLQRFFPRLSLRNSVEWQACIRRQGKRKVFIRTIQTGFKRACSNGECDKSNCAKCWALANLNPKGDWEIYLRQVPTTGKAKIVDPAGVDPHGRRSGSAQAMGEDQRAMHRMTSTIHSYKSGSASWH